VSVVVLGLSHRSALIALLEAVALDRQRRLGRVTLATPSYRKRLKAHNPGR